MYYCTIARKALCFVTTQYLSVTTIAKIMI